MICTVTAKNLLEIRIAYCVRFLFNVQIVLYSEYNYSIYVHKINHNTKLFVTLRLVDWIRDVLEVLNENLYLPSILKKQMNNFTVIEKMNAHNKTYRGLCQFRYGSVTRV